MSTAGPAPGGVGAEPPGLAPAAPDGVIHDIGYRHYAGERLDRRAITRSLYVASLRGCFGLGRSGRSKVVPMLLAIAMSLPAIVIVAVINLMSLDSQPLAYSGYATALQLVLAIFVASQAPQLVSRDLRFRTITLYLARPLERVDYVTAKLAAMVSAIFLVTAVPLLVLYVGGLIGGLDLQDETTDLLGALVGVVVLALLVGGLGLLLAALTPRRGFAAALVIVVLMVSYGAVNAVAAVALETGNDGLAGWVGLLSPLTLFDGVQVVLFNAQSASAAPPPDGVGGLVYCVVAVAFAVGSYLLLQLRYRRLAAA